MWRVFAGPTVTEFLLLETAASFGLSDSLQDAVAGAIGDATSIPLAQVKDLLVGVGVGLAAAKRIVGRLVSCSVAVWQCVALFFVCSRCTSQGLFLVLSLCQGRWFFFFQ